jgi:cytochrome c-type biogenesis protein CcmH/NrfF
VLLKRGEEAKVGRYTIRNTGIKVSDDGQKQATTAYLDVFVDGKQIDSLYPAKWAFRNHENEPTTEVAIRRTFAEDLYIVLAFQPSDLATQTATLQIVVNPLVNWIWFGFGIMALGTGIALLPERAYSFALAKMPATEAATTAVTLLALLLVSGGRLSAQAGMGPTGPAGVNVQTSYYARTEFEKKMQHEIVCTCGTCGHQTIAECRKDPCGTSHQMREELAAYIDKGMDRDQIIQAFITKYDSEEMLGAPIDKGFSRLAWLFPYLVGATSAVAIGFAAVKWSRKPEEPVEAAPVDSALDERIDDELRDLD